MGGMRSILTLVVFLALAAPARAGTYEHDTLSAGSPGLDGWSPHVRAPGGFVATGAAPGTLIARFWARPWFAPGDAAEWSYTPPADTTIAAWDIEWSVGGIAGGDWNTLLGAVSDGRLRYLATDVPSRNRAWTWLHAGGLGAGRLIARLQCGGPHACTPAGAAQLALRNARVTLADPYAPSASEVQGDLARDGTLVGKAALSFVASDRGGGVYRAFPKVDGVAGPPVGFDCHDLGAPRRFAARRPCPLSAGATVAVDTTKLPDGRHTIAVELEDVAGNAVTVYGPTSRVVDNIPTPSPQPSPTPRPAPTPAAPSPRAVTAPVNLAAWLVRRGRRALTVTTPYGERVRISGRLTDLAGRPVAGAAIELAERVRAPHALWNALTGLRTRADGRFTVFTRVGPSRRLRIATAGGVRAPALSVYVRAPLTVRRAGVLVRGRLRGGYVPRAGALVEMQTRARGRWVTRRVVRTWSSGRFSARLPGGRVRAVVPRQPGLPYVAGRATTVSPRRTGGRTGPRTSR